ncbi:MAG: tetratricopeptide repeat protein, partial [Saprospiraceae bacterium]
MTVVDTLALMVAQTDERVPRAVRLHACDLLLRHCRAPTVANEALEGLVAQCVHEHGDGGEATIDALFLLAAAHLDRHADAEAKSIYTRLLPNVIARFGEESDQATKVYIGLATCASHLSDFATGARLLQDKIVVRTERLHGPMSAETGAALHELGIAFGNLGDYGARRTVQQRTQEIMERVYGTDHDKTAMSRLALAIVHGCLGEYVDEAAEVDRVYITWYNLYGDDHHRTAYAWYFRGVAAGALGDAQTQKDALLMALSARRKHFGEEGKLTLVTRLALCTVSVPARNVGDKVSFQLDATKAAEAQSIVDTIIRVCGPDTAAVAVASGVLALLKAAAGNIDGAFLDADRAVAIEASQGLHDGAHGPTKAIR